MLNDSTVATISDVVNAMRDVFARISVFNMFGFIFTVIGGMLLLFYL